MRGIVDYWQLSGDERTALRADKRIDAVAMHGMIAPYRVTGLFYVTKMMDDADRRYIGTVYEVDIVIDAGRHTHDPEYILEMAHDELLYASDEIHRHELLPLRIASACEFGPGVSIEPETSGQVCADIRAVRLLEGLRARRGEP